ncbi:hypothetical protein BDN70DRAFT_673456 [Pholiota conissans]|uniref:Uncharacterized protein n=1 Tax=Pholiota conissans TaxID=109636 RepID=A0A9P5YKT2_9AGAR|nr:hypothetical protein BDN70DRAFT_673456 [Pholiota conissans]
MRRLSCPRAQARGQAQDPHSSHTPRSVPKRVHLQPRIDNHRTSTVDVSHRSLLLSLLPLLSRPSSNPPPPSLSSSTHPLPQRPIFSPVHLPHNIRPLLLLNTAPNPIIPSISLQLIPKQTTMPCSVQQ